MRLGLSALLLAPLLASAQTPNPSNLWVVDITWRGDRPTFGTPRNLTNDRSGSQPAFTPDGNAVLFSASRDGATQTDIYRIDLATGTETRVTRTPENENSPMMNERGEYMAVRWNPATLFKEFGPWVYSSNGEPARGVLRGPDSTGYYRPLPGGNFALTRPKSRSFTLGLFDNATGAITDVDSGIPALPPQLIPGANALSYVRVDTATGRHTLHRVDLGTRRTSSIGRTLVGRNVHVWLPGRETILMGKGNALYARKPGETTWSVLATFDHPELRNISAYAVSARGDKLILTSPKRLGLAVVLRDSLEAGRSGAEVVAMATSMKAAGAFAHLDVSENGLIGVGDELVQRKRAADGVAVLTFVTAQYPQSFRAFDRLGDAQAATGDRAAAQASYRKSLEVNPQTTDPQRAAAAAVQKKISGTP